MHCNLGCVGRRLQIICVALGLRETLRDAQNTGICFARFLALQRGVSACTQANQIKKGYGEKGWASKRPRSMAKLVHETEAGKRNHTNGGAILEEEISHFDGSAVRLNDVGLDLCSGTGTSLDSKSFQGLFGGDFHIDRELGGKLYGVVHGIISIGPTTRGRQKSCKVESALDSFFLIFLQGNNCEGQLGTPVVALRSRDRCCYLVLEQEPCQIG